MNRWLVCVCLLVIFTVVPTDIMAEELSSSSAKIALGAVDLAACVSFHPLIGDYIILKQAIENQKSGIVRALKGANELMLRSLDNRLKEIERKLDIINRASTDNGQADHEVPSPDDGPVMVSINLSRYDQPDEEVLTETDEPLDANQLSDELYRLKNEKEKVRAKVKYIQTDEARQELTTMGERIKRDVLQTLRELCATHQVAAVINFSHSSLNLNKRVLPHTDGDIPISDAEAGEMDLAPVDVEVTFEQMLHFSEIFWTEENASQLRSIIDNELVEFPYYLKLFRGYLETRLFVHGKDKASFEDVFLTRMVVKENFKKYSVAERKVEFAMKLLARYFEPGSDEGETEE